MTISESRTEPVFEAGCALIVAEGELDLLTAPDLELELGAALRNSGPPRLLIDLKAVTFMDISPLRVLCRALAEARRRGGWVRLVYTRPLVAKLLKAARLAEEFPQYLCVEDAVANRPLALCLGEVR